MFIHIDTHAQTFDVESLYTNIDTELGLQAIKFWVEKFPNKVLSRFSVDFICDAIKLILENNIFFFNDNYYKQISGTAMGTKFAPSYPNLVLAYLKHKL